MVVFTSLYYALPNVCHKQLILLFYFKCSKSFYQYYLVKSWKGEKDTLIKSLLFFWILRVFLTDFLHGTISIMQYSNRCHQLFKTLQNKRCLWHQRRSLKSIKDFIIVPHIKGINRCILFQNFPSFLRLAFVRPLHKKESLDGTNNSLLKNFLPPNCLLFWTLFPVQFRFWSRRS